ncbi:Ltp family lipoprotein [Tessaracoccus lacteus]|uniref:Ltp family lipoprotein n=1 Tax=Tessaracoccus lacteus TaxID=3041766 RepID=A0ABY8PV64_9ACTN|nr:Ltp family lipoprotein [Tessaracoccus sp. T21]WGT46353.1 Ltp family lipoprotein [Tessaracoccus sp. T21]
MQMNMKRVRAGLVGLVALATMSAGVLTATPAAAAGNFTGVSKPTISGTRAVASKLTAKADTATKPTAAKMTYQWLRSGSKISGATAKTYTLKSADKGRKISVKVCYLAFDTNTRCVTSAKTGAIEAKVLKTLSVSTPKVSGVAKVGATLRASTGSWTSGTTFTYKWLRNGKTIPGATKSTYKPTSADKGRTIQVKVTGKKSGYTTRAKSSAKTAKVTSLSSTQRQAVSEAKSYLEVLYFSRTGLIDQLEYEGFSTSTSKVAVDYVNPSWNKQAAGSAQSYVDTFGYDYFTWDELYDQLRWEGFTASQATYGVNAVGL